ncbi:MAG TPA: hypothetical protein PLO24_06605 [Bacteroidales bacterium]|jgi:major membrane immunogen (membrane-anchored lipoprotein)|nr:hypothetical protein [Bacteroidales bacterium]HOS71992.1 hypothetical protein [Bacteroidales bacterium]HQH23007.1 hypothetical protein [Bacteroidales bacterium]HQJ82170.1 hypothetical protein [Bacteroidales bacterium]
MKKILFISMALSVLLLNGCKKEETGLSEFILGDWATDKLTFSENQKGIIHITFQDNNEYELSIEMIPGHKNGSIKGQFEVDNKTRMLTLDSDAIIRLLGLETSGDPIMFNVEFSTTSDVDEMTLRLASLPEAVGEFVPSIVLKRVSGQTS